MSGQYWYPCGQCMPCRVRRRQEWAARILLESRCHEASTFWTLTYEHDPVQLHFEDLTAFLKSFRKVRRFRYFAVGEYGDQRGRPHFHAVLFGVDLSYYKELLSKWDNGFIQGAELNEQRAQYVARYTTKKLNGNLAEKDNRTPESARMSRRPGVGQTFCSKLAAAVQQSAYYKQREREWKEFPSSSSTIRFRSDLVGMSPRYVRLGKRLWPLDRYMRSEVFRCLDPTAMTSRERNAMLVHETEFNSVYADEVGTSVVDAMAAEKAIKKVERVKRRRGVL